MSTQRRGNGSNTSCIPDGGHHICMWGKAGRHHHESGFRDFNPRKRISIQRRRRKCLSIQCERKPIVSKSGSRDLCEQVVLLVEDKPPQGPSQARQTLTLVAGADC
jgi:hypothetical protein